MRAVQTGGFKPSTAYGNMLIVLFAGHDTTGHTMTWLLFELARNPGIQREVTPADHIPPYPIPMQCWSHLPSSFVNFITAVIV